MHRMFAVWTRCGLLAVVCSVCGMPVLAQEIPPAPLPHGAEPDRQSDALKSDTPDGEDADADDFDKLLKLDVESLSKVPVLEATMTDPVVEAVSKTPEKASEAPGIVDVITAKDIEEFGAKNLYEVLEWATSVYMTGSFLFRRNIASIRGNLVKHEDNHVLVLINGRPYRDITLGGVNVSIYTAFPIHTIERVEILRGPGSVLYGTNAFTGVINVVTKDPDKPTFHASVLSGSYGWQSYSLATGTGNKTRGIYGGAAYNRGKGWPFTATSEDPPGPTPPVTDTALFGEDDVGVFAMYRNRGFTANVFIADPASEIVGSQPLWPSYTLDARHIFLDLGYLLELGRQRSLALNFTYNYAETDFPSVLSTPGLHVPFFCPSHSFLLEGTYRAELLPELNMMVGALTDIHMGKADMGPFHPIPEFDEIWYGVYTQLDYRVNDWLKLVGGMQANMPGEIPGGIVPRAAVIASLNENWTTKFLYGQAFRSPYQVERSMSVPGVLQGNPNLLPETIQTFDVQLAYHTEGSRLAATYFHSDYFDMIIRTGTLPETYGNRGRMQFQGAELENEWRISERLRWLGSMTYQDNVRDGIHNTSYVPNWMAKMGLAYQDGNGLNVGLFDTFFGRVDVPPTAAIVNPNPEANHLVSLNMTLDLNRRLHWHTGRSMKLQFLIQNLLNESVNHVEFQRKVINTLPGGPGRTFYGGFSMGI